jgi:hypothetical protein
MNVRPARSIDARCATRLAVRSAALGALVLVGACAGRSPSEARIDPASPIAGEVARVRAMKAPFPSFRQIPPRPKDIRAPQAYAAEVADAKAAAGRLEQATAPETWTLTGSQAFASAAQRAVGAEPAPANGDDTEAFARGLRERATPPPSPR